MSIDLDLIKNLNELISIIQKENSLIILCSLILPGGSKYLLFRKEFTGSLEWFILINFLLFILIYVIFLRIRKGLKLKILGKRDYILLI